MAPGRRTFSVGAVGLLALAVALSAAAPAGAGKAECGPLRGAIAENGRKAEKIEHLLTVAEMTQAATLGYLSDLAERRRKVVQDLIRYGRLGCDWKRLDYAPKPR